MPILKSFFASSNGQVPTTAAAAPPVEVPQKSRAPSVVARLMGLDMLPPETVQPRKKQVDENAMQGSNGTKQSNAAAGKPSHSSRPQSRSFDQVLEPVGKLNLGDQYQTRKSQEVRQQEADCLRTTGKSHGLRQQEADCLTTIRLEELNKQLLMKHMRVLDELSRAKQLVTDSMAADKRQQQPRRGLSDTTEYMDALELLEVNRQFFEKYFRSSEMKSVATAILKPDPRKLPAAKGPKASYLRNGQSSPRPPPGDFAAATLETQKPIVVLKPRRLLTSESSGQLRGPDAAEILSNAGTNTRQLVSKALEKPPTKDAKDLAKLIAKRIKEGIAKEVAKTFTSSAHSSELLQSDTPGKYSVDELSNRSGEIGRRSDPRERSPRTSKSAVAESQSPRSKKLSAESGQAESPRTRSKSSSTDPKVETKRNASPEAEQRMKVDGRKSAPIKSRSSKPAGSSSKAGSRVNTEISSRAKPVSSRQTASAPPNAGPKVLDRSPTLPPKYRNATAGIGKGVLKERKQTQKSVSNNSSRSRTVHEEETTAAGTSEDFLELPIDLKAGEPSVEVNRLGTSLTALENVTPPKEQGALNAAGTTTECSPVSVLDVNAFNEDEVEHVKEVISEQGICVSTADANKKSQRREQQPLTTTVEAAIDSLVEQESRQDVKQEEVKEDETRVDARKQDIVKQAIKERTRQLQVEVTEAITCPVDRQEELDYLRDLIAASDLKLDGRPTAARTEFSLDSLLFEKLEEQYSRQGCEELVDRVKVHARAVKRWLVFDLANEVLATPAWKHKVETGRGLVEELWSSIVNHSRQLKDSESLDSLVEAEMGCRSEWTEAKDEVMELCSDVEAVIFKELVEEAIRDMVCW